MSKKDQKFYHLFRGKRYLVNVTSKGIPSDRHGDCDPPDKAGKKIRIRRTLNEKDFLNTAIDESIHACLFDLDNDTVVEMAESIGNFLRKLGYKRDELERKN